MASSSSSMAATPASPATSHLSSTLGGAAPSGSAVIAAQFREIHKNTWLKRLTAEGKKITVGPKKSDRSWVVFCVHDDTEALLEGYAEPRQAAGHSPEWIVSMQDTLHISHALIPNSHEFEFVVTLSNEVVRFHAMSWEIMQEWVETLRLKLREMKILSPRENLYTKLPEIRAPLLPTRDPTSPLPAPPPVPAALVPGVERVVPPSLQQETAVTAAEINADTTTRCTTAAATLTTTSHSNASQYTLRTTSSSSSSSNNSNISIAATAANQVSSTATVTTVAPTPMLSAMSNTLTQNLLNMLSDPISAYSEQLNGVAAADEDANSVDYFEEDNLFTEQDLSDDDFQQELLSRLLRKSCREHSETAALTDNSVRVDVGASNRTSADQIKNWENLMHAERPSQSRPQTSRSLSAGAADETRRSSSRKQTSKLNSQHHETLTTSSSNNITELEISADSTIPVTTTATTSTPTTRSSSTPTVPTATEADKTNITIIQVSTTTDVDSVGANERPAEPTSKPKLPTKHITAEIFKFPETYIPIAAATTAKAKQHEYKSNVQIIPSNIATNSSTIQVLGHQHVGGSTPANQYSSPVKKHPPAAMNAKVTAAGAAAASHHKITTVHVAGDATTTTTTTTTVTTSASQTSSGISIYGTCFTAAPSTSTVTQAQSVAAGTPKLPKKIILSANTSGVTNITVNNAFGAHTPDLRARSNDEIAGNIGCDGAVKHNAGTVHYEKVFLSSSVPITPAATAIVSAAPTMASMSPKTQSAQWNSPKRQAGALIPITSQTSAAEAAHTSSNSPSSPTPAAEMRRQKLSVTTAATQTPTTVASASKGRTKSTQSSASTSNRANIVGGSPALERRRIASPGSQCVPTTSQPPLPLRPPFLTRGLTEAVITTRPSRRDFHFLKQTVGKSKAPHAVASANTNKSLATTSTNNNDDVGNAAMPVTVSRANSELQEQRKRSSSTSDARNNARGTNNNEFPGGRGAGTGGPGGGGGGYAALRIQQPPQPFRSVENGTGGMPPVPSNATGPTGNSPAAKRMTLREQQVMQLRREIMHPGGVRLQLRRKDCVGSIAWVDAFGAVWVAGWKQKEHPVLYNALHIGDQLLSIAGISINAAAEANKIIRNTNTLFVEVLVRRIPFGRGYAIRREREGQCLGLIRDGNTSTIVDVVPNSLAARHGLPPKAQSCDGVTLTFWVLTEINGRPLNLFFKDNEIRDRLNSVGRDISILVQPSDLIVKLKKQLKSLRGYKDYLVQ